MELQTKKGAKVHEGNTRKCQLFRNHLDRTHGRILAGWNKLQQQFSLCVWLQARDSPNEGMILSRLAGQVQLPDHESSVAKDVEYAIGAHGTIVRSRGNGSLCTALDEMQGEPILSRRDRYGIREVSPTLGLIQFRILVSDNGFLTARKLAGFEICVGTPPLAVIGIVRNIAGDDAHRSHVRTIARENLNGRNHASPGRGGEGQVQDSVLSR